MYIYPLKIKNIVLYCIVLYCIVLYCTVARSADVFFRARECFARESAMLTTIWPAQNTPALQANENGKTAMGLDCKTATLHVQHAFCTLLCRHCRTTT